jgi:hypothetical protein
MNDAPIKQPDATTTDTPAELQEPHFDEIAVFIAQPVEPIAPSVYERWLALLEEPRTVLAIVFISSMMGLTALALTLQLHTQPHVDTAATEIQTGQTTSAPEPQVVADTEQQSPEPQVVADTEQQRARPQRSKVSKTRSRVEDDDSKPKARRVGVIHYGSSRP